jgi:hypothetical protein
MERTTGGEARFSAEGGGEQGDDGTKAAQQDGRPQPSGGEVFDGGNRTVSRRETSECFSYSRCLVLSTAGGRSPGREDEGDSRRVGGTKAKPASPWSREEEEGIQADRWEMEEVKWSRPRCDRKVKSDESNPVGG